MVINESKGRVNPRTHHPIGSFTKLPFFPCCLVVYLPPLWKMMDFVSWDDDMTPIFLESHNPAMFQTSNQPKNPWIKGRVNPWTNHPIGCLKLPAEQGRPCNGGPWAPGAPAHALPMATPAAKEKDTSLTWSLGWSKICWSVETPKKMEWSMIQFLVLVDSPNFLRTSKSWSYHGPTGILSHTNWVVVPKSPFDLHLISHLKVKSSLKASPKGDTAPTLLTPQQHRSPHSGCVCQPQGCGQVVRGRHAEGDRLRQISSIEWPRGTIHEHILQYHEYNPRII